MLLPQLSPLTVEDSWRLDGVLTIAAHPRARGPDAGDACGCPRGSTTNHRPLTDLPVAVEHAVVGLRVLRFFCDQADCRAGTFAEQIPGLTARHAKRTAGAQDALVAVALALAGRAGSSLATAWR